MIYFLKIPFNNILSIYIKKNIIIMQNTLLVPLHKICKNGKYFQMTCIINLQILHYIIIKFATSME